MRKNPLRLLALAGSAVALSLGLVPAASALDIGTPGAALWLDGGRVIEGDLGLVGAPAAIRLSAPLTQPVTVFYQFVSNPGCTAMNGVDFLLETKAASFAAGETKKAVSANVIGDPLAEADECFHIKLVSIQGQGAGQIKSWEQQDKLYIVDDDH